MPSVEWVAGALVVVLAVLGVLFKIAARDRAHHNEALEALRAHTTATAKDIYVQLTNFRVEVAKEYATNSYLREVEGRIMALLASLDGKLERLIRNSAKK